MMKVKKYSKKKSPETEKQLAGWWEKYNTVKDKQSKDKLIITYLPLVKYIAGRMAISMPSHIDSDDLISSGVIGLIKAIERYDVNCGTQFETYATTRIKGSILDELRSLDWVPRSVRGRAKLLQKVYTALEEQLGRQPTDEEVANHLEISEKELRDWINYATPTTLISLNTVLNSGDDDKPLQIIDTIEDLKYKSPLGMSEQKELEGFLSECINDLNPQEKMVVILYYYEGLMLKEIGRILGVSESRVSQVHTKSMLRLKGKLNQRMKEYTEIC
ncbi:FliA/WhiG family RNA polymerase sigma factor [bacterium]|nr:FliA/WhiG family RNA polymerase sigma factor [bacterium]